VRARAYAMANNTYVFVGISEVDASVPTSTTPQTAGNGRMGVAVVASNDGTRTYDSNNPGPIPATATPPSVQSTLGVVSPLRRFENVHLLNASTISAAKLPNGTESTVNIGTTASLTTFQWPLAATGSSPQFKFGNEPGSVIQFNPQGEAQVISVAMADSVLEWIEIDLQPTHGKTLPVANNNTATILIDGPSGAVTLYRP
jgi:hypothetical protein